MALYLGDILGKPSLKDAGLHPSDVNTDYYIGDDAPAGKTKPKDSKQFALDTYNNIKDKEQQLYSFFETPAGGSSAKPVIYSEWSPVSKFFGMSQDTAFSEHMANTAHQREVADLRAAGLNPVLGISGSGASSVSGNAAVGSSSAAKAENFPWLDVLGATAGLVTTVVTKKPSLGYMVANVFRAFDK